MTAQVPNIEMDAEAVALSKMNALDVAANPVQAYLDNVQ